MLPLQKNNIWYTYALDFPKPDQLVKNQLFLHIQGWIASDKQISNIHIQSKYKFSLEEYSRPDVVEIYPQKYVVGFRYILNPEVIVNLPDNPRIFFKTGSKKGEISIDSNIIKKFKKIANLLQKNRTIFFILLLKTKRDNTFIKR